MPLGEFLDEQLARVRESEDSRLDVNCLLCLRVMLWMKKLLETFLLAKIDMIKLLAKLKEKSLNARMKYDPVFATSPICISDKDYDFPVDPELITLVESNHFYVYESEIVVAHLTKINDIATLSTNDEKTRYYYILKLFPFSLKGDAKHTV